MRLEHFMRVLSGIGILFTLYAIFLISTSLLEIPWGGYKQAVSAAENYSLENLSAPDTKPDVYYIVLDGYARADILQEMFDFDNSEFISYLQQAGFIVPESNRSNYPATPLSIASTLNMDYVQSFVPALDAGYQRWLMAPFIDHSRVRSLLESHGYQTVSISSNWTITANPTTDLYYHAFPVQMTDFEGFLLDLTPLQLFEPALKGFASLPNAAAHREIIRYNFETLTELPKLSGPKFIFAHIISPHPPFVFDRDGGAIDSSVPFSFQDANEFSGSSSEYAQRYTEQVQFVNDNLRRIIGEILAQSETPPIIILLADHGSGLRTDLTSSGSTCIRERFSPFAAYYLPGTDADVVPPDISNVNIFRILFNEYFDADLPLLEDRQFFYKDMLTYYDFEDVSARMDEECAAP